jgi:hypothetical protein
VGVRNQVTFLILYYPSSRLIPLLDVINTPIQVPDIVDLTKQILRTIICGFTLNMVLGASVYRKV